MSGSSWRDKARASLRATLHEPVEWHLDAFPIGGSYWSDRLAFIRFMQRYESHVLVISNDPRLKVVLKDLLGRMHSTERASYRVYVQYRQGDDWIYEPL